MAHRRMVARLHADAAVTALVPAARIRPIKLRQSDALPGITYPRGSFASEDGISQIGNTWILDVTVSVWANTYDEAMAVADAVRDCLHGWRDGNDPGDVMSCRLQSESDAPEAVEPGGDEIVHGITQEYRIEWLKPSE
jgi:hypothetical protein